MCIKKYFFYLIICKYEENVWMDVFFVFFKKFIMFFYLKCEKYFFLYIMFVYYLDLEIFFYYLS